MSTGGDEGVDRQALSKMLAASGVRVTAEEAEAVLRAVARVRAAAASLLESQSFDDTAESYFRLLESDGADGAEA